MADFYQFVEADTTALIEDKISEYEKLIGRTVNAADPDRLFLLWAINALLIERQLLNYTGNQNIPSRAEGANLDALAELFYEKTRPKEQAAECTVRFTITAAQLIRILIPAGTRVTDTAQTLYWETKADAYIEPGDLSVDADVICQTTGTVGNHWPAGSINTIVDLYDYVDGCANITESDLGADEATDEEFYELMRQSMEAYSTAGSRGSYIYHAMSVSTELADVIAVNPKKDEEGNQIDGAGLVEIYALGSDGDPASEEMKDAIYAACSPDDVRPLTDHVTVKDPVPIHYSIDFTFYIPRTSPQGGAAITEAVKAAVEDYKTWQSGRLGRDINPSQLIGRIMECGVKRVVVRAPVYTTLSDGTFENVEEYRKPEYAVCDSVTTVNGGAEEW